MSTRVARRTGTSAGRTATYVYALLRRRSLPPLEAAPAGVPRADPLRALPAGEGLWLIVATAPLSLYGSDPIRRKLRDLEWVSACAMAHDSVVAHFMGSGDLVPMRLFTLFSSDERALADVTRRRRPLRRLLDQVKGREEWGLRLSLQRSRTQADSGRDAAGASDAALSAGAGRRFLLRKRDQQSALGRLATEASREADLLFRELRRHAAGAARRAPATSAPGTRLVLDAAFLVATGRRARFHAAVRRAQARLARQGYALTLTGPWPPYNFVGARE